MPETQLSLAAHVTVAEQLKSDLATAMKAGEKERVGALRMVLSEVQKDAKVGRGRRAGGAAPRAQAPAGGGGGLPRGGPRRTWRRTEEGEAELIAGYLPAEVPDAELKEIVERAVRESGAESVRDMGRAMGVAMAAVDGRADGKRVSGLVRAALDG